MENLQCFIKIDVDRIKIYDIVRYGSDFNEDNVRYMYVSLRHGEESFEYYADEVEFELEEKLDELDKIFLIEPRGQNDYLKRFVKFGDERIKVDEIINYGIAKDLDDELYLYVGIKYEEEFNYYKEEVDFDLDDKLNELDEIFLNRRFITR